mgnify:CR=1 FL=1
MLLAALQEVAEIFAKDTASADKIANETLKLPPGILAMLSDILADEGFRTLTTASGEDALRLYREQHPAAVFLDIWLPGMDGMELLRRIGTGPSAPRVVLVTAHGSERQAVEAIKAGAWDYFRKPFDNDELLAVVRRAVEAAERWQIPGAAHARLSLAKSLPHRSRRSEAKGQDQGQVHASEQPHNKGSCP